MGAYVDSQVECYSGSTYGEAPRRFTFQDKQLEVKSILSRGRQPEGLFFHVLGSDDGIYELVFVIEKDHWQVKQFV